MFLKGAVCMFVGSRIQQTCRDKLVLHKQGQQV